jgi:predicted alpha/beta-hydrolase family hydrolase
VVFCKKSGNRDSANCHGKPGRLKQVATIAVEITSANNARMESSMKILSTGPENAAVAVLLAHGAGAPMDSPSMNAAAMALAVEGLRVHRFEFSYMAARRTGQRKPPPKAESLMGEFRAAVDAVASNNALIIGGKSMGGRVASMVADELHTKGKINGLLCLGYPFHPPQKAEQLRTWHLARLATPALFVQGTRDTFGNREEVAGYELSPRIEILWLEDGDHDLKPRKQISGISAADHLKTMARAVHDWSARLTGAR